jgi:hypothetical protein
MRSPGPSRLLVCVALLFVACSAGRDDPTTVHDLRVLGLSLEPPELLIPGCDAGLFLALAGTADGGRPTLDPALTRELFDLAARSLRFTALIADPDGGARPLDYRLRACASADDRDCSDPGQSVELGAGTTTAGELGLTVAPAAQLLPDAAHTPLVLAVIQQDPYRGLGGVRVPLVLELLGPGGREHLYAQKLMVYTCQLFPEQRQNVTPRLPGLTWSVGDAGVEAWPEGEVKRHQGRAEVTLQPVDFSALEEAYVVPSLSLTPIALQESWKLNWMTTSGSLGSYQTGGTDLGGTTQRHRNTWRPDAVASEGGRVTLWVVVRDGRGGESWLTRQIDWTP